MRVALNWFNLEGQLIQGYPRRFKMGPVRSKIGKIIRAMLIASRRNTRKRRNLKGGEEKGGKTIKGNSKKLTWVTQKKKG